MVIYYKLEILVKDVIIDLDFLILIRIIGFRDGKVEYSS